MIFFPYHRITDALTALRLKSVGHIRGAQFTGIISDPEGQMSKDPEPEAHKFISDSPVLTVGDLRSDMTA
jgi:hypothetical protein